MGRSRIACALLAFGCWASSAAAQPTPVPTRTLRWSRGAPGCITAARLRSAVEAMIARPVFAEGSEVRIDGRVGGVAGAWTARFEVRTADGRLLGVREVTAPGDACNALDEALTVVLAMLVELDAPRSSLRVTPRPRPPPQRIAVGARVSAGAGLLPAPWVAPTVSFGWEPTAVRLEIDATWLAPRELAVEGTAAVAELQAFLVGVHGCARVLRAGDLSGRGCLGARAGVLHASAEGFDENRAASAATAAVVASATLELGLGAFWALALRGELSGHPVAERFTYTAPSGERVALHETSRVSGLLGLGLVFVLGEPDP